MTLFAVKGWEKIQELRRLIGYGKQVSIVNVYIQSVSFNAFNIKNIYKHHF